MIVRQDLHTEPVITASCLLVCAGTTRGAVVDPMTDVHLYLREIPPPPPGAGETRAQGMGLTSGAPSA